MFSDDMIDLDIKVKAKSFGVELRGSEMGNYEFDKSGFQPWSVDHIKVFLFLNSQLSYSQKKVTDGQFFVAPKIDIIRKSKINNLELPYMLMLNNSLVAAGNTIEIKGKKNWNFDHFTVHLFHGAKNFDKTGNFCNFLS